MRIFIGIPLPSDVKFYLRETQTEILRYKAKGNLTQLENFHITLLFLGDIEGSKVDVLCDVLDEKLKDISSFDFHLDGIGSFAKGIDQIIWVGLRKNIDIMRKIHQRIKEAVKDLQLPFDDKKFKPHITLARQVRFDEPSMIHQLKMYQPAIIADKIHIYESHRVNDVLTYTPLYTIKLKK